VVQYYKTWFRLY